jgi:hypothetical protein
MGEPTVIVLWVTLVWERCRISPHCAIPQPVPPLPSHIHTWEGHDAQHHQYHILACKHVTSDIIFQIHSNLMMKFYISHPHFHIHSGQEKYWNCQSTSVSINMNKPYFGIFLINLFHNGLTVAWPQSTKQALTSMPFFSSKRAFTGRISLIVQMR